MWFDLEGKVALVTGGGRGLGRGIAARLARAGARVAVNDVDEASAETAANAIRESGGIAVSVPGDIASSDAVEAIFDRVDQLIAPPDILVNNAGVVLPADIFEADLASWQRVLDVNLTGAFLCSKAAMTRMRARGKGGRIVMLGSVVGHQGAVGGWPAYGATKSALHGLAKSLARTAATFGATVNIVAPGVIDTQLLTDSHGAEAASALANKVPLGRLGSIDDVAAAIHFLCSEEAAYITGATIDVNGGFYIRA